MKQVTVRFTATFETKISVPDNPTNADIEAATWDADIPESETAKYVEDSFGVVRDDEGNVKVFGV